MERPQREFRQWAEPEFQSQEGEGHIKRFNPEPTGVSHGYKKALCRCEYVNMVSSC